MLDIYHVPNGYMVKGEYEIIHKTAEGGTSAVYLAQKGPLKTKYAIKFVDLRKNERDRENYIKEILLMKDIYHPNISKIVDHEDHKDYFIAVFLYVNGPTLSEVVKVNGPFNENETLDIANTLCDVLDYLHHSNETDKILYCDLKPDNVMLENGIAKLIDFGNSKKMDHGKPIKLQIDENKGTKGYAAPEQYEVGNYIDERTDIYGFGATLYTLLTGEKGNIQMDGMHPSEKANVSEGLDYIISKCTRINPDNRYQNVRALKADLDNVGHFNASYAQTIKKKIIMFYVCCIACALCFVGIFVSFASIRFDNNKLYRTYYNAGQKYEQTKQLDKAQESYLKAIASAPQNTEAYERLFYMMLPSTKNNVIDVSTQTKAALDTFRNNVDTDDLMNDPTLAYNIAREAIGVNDPVYTQYAEEVLSKLKKTKAYKQNAIDKTSVDSMYLIAHLSNATTPNYHKLNNTLHTLYQSTKHSSLSDSDKMGNYYIILTLYNTYPNSLDVKQMNNVAKNAELLLKKNRKNKEFTFNKTISFFQMMASRNAIMASSEQNKQSKQKYIDASLYWFNKMEKTGVTLDESSYISKGSLYHSMNDFTNSKKAYKNALTINPNNVEALIQLSQTCIDEQKTKGSHDFSEAKQYYDKANNIIQNNPNQSNTVLDELSSLKTQLQTI